MTTGRYRAGVAPEDTGLPKAALAPSDETFKALLNHGGHPEAEVEKNPCRLRLMAVHAHPDDESSKGAGTMARYVDEGAEVTVVTCTGGERGDILNPRLKDDPEANADLSAVRHREMDRAREILGINQVWLGYVDSGLPEGDPLPALPDGCFALIDPEEAARPLVKLVRELRPHVMLTYDENGGYPHPDHIHSHRISMLAYELAADPSYMPELGEPWAVAKIYYQLLFPPAQMIAYARYMRKHGLDNPFEAQMEYFEGLDQRPITTRVNVSRYLDVRDAALLAHATQVDPGGFFFAVSNEIKREAWPTEDFQLRHSRIGVTLPESDLFEGIRQ